MKFNNLNKKIRVIFNVILLIFIQINLCYTLNVGFMTSNAEGSILTAEDQIKILNAFQHYSKNFKIKMILEKDISKPGNETYSKIDNSYDILFFSFQETSDKFNLDILHKNLNKKIWICPETLSKTGKTKLLGGNVLTLVSLCYKKAILAHTFIKKEKYATYNVIEVGNTKTTLGLCLKKVFSPDSSQFCFLGGHFDTSLDKSIDVTTMKMIRKIRNYMKENKVIDYTIYSLGDFNIRLWKEVDSSNIDNILEQSLKGLKDDTFKNPVSQFDIKPVEYFQNKIKELSKTEFNEEYLIKFCGNENLRKLPFTYKFRGIKNDKEITQKNSENPISKENYNKEGILEKKEAYKNFKVNNFGWLDRFACLHKGSDSQGCKIKGGVENVNYAIVPSLRQGDHMPLIGFFTIEDKKRKLK